MVGTQVVVDNSGGSGFNVGDIINFGELDGGEYKVTAISISADTLTFERFGSANTEGGIRTPGQESLLILQIFADDGNFMIYSHRALSHLIM